MFRIFKCTAFGVLALLGAGFAIFGAHFPSYVGTSVSLASKAGKDRIPIEFELRRAEGLIDGILPEIQACKTVIAEEEVAIVSLKKEIGSLEKAQARGEEKVRALRGALGGPGEHFRFAGAEYSRPAVENELERSFDAFRNEASLLESKRRLLESRDRSLAAARAKLDAVRGEKGNLETHLQGLHAQLRQVQALESTTKVALDAGRLQRAKQVLSECQHRLDVAQRVIEQDAVEAPSIPFPSGPDRDLVAEVDRFLGERAEAGKGAEATPALAAAKGASR
ncbi:MAG TPA: hypothetical protein VFI25_08755 [Planctomycetota bacterium]|jgi:hypothetical protein|nr:hypothetical protein [Planctomycetota bacterium]